MLDLSRIEALCGADRLDAWSPPNPLVEGFLPIGTPIVAPASIDEAAEILRFAAHEKLQLLLMGAGEHIYRGARMPEVDLVLSTRDMSRVLEYEPEDLTLVAQAGLTLSALERLTDEHGQRLAVDLSQGRAATLGGAVAANRKGLNSLRAGGLRDAVLGARVVHADGSVTKTGGKVVKNVTGYDLAKLYLGSFGSLVLIAEINLRLVTRPHLTQVVVCRLERSRARDAFLAVHHSGLQPSAILATCGAVTPVLSTTEDDLLLVARFDGREAVVREQSEALLGLLPAHELQGEQAIAAYRELGGFLEPEPDSMLVCVSTLPVNVLDVLEHAVPGLEEPLTMVAQFGVGTTHIRLPRSTVAGLGSWFALLEARGARIQVEYAPVDLAVPSAISAAPLSALQLAMKAAFDPENRLRGVPLPSAG